MSVHTADKIPASSSEPDGSELRVSEAVFPLHKCGLFLTHNEHRDYYETAERWAAENMHFDWVSDEQRQLSIETDSLWTIQWYPDTPIGFYSLCAADLDVLLDAARRTQ